MIAAAITANLKAAGLTRKGPDAIYTILVDGDIVHKMTEPMLDEYLVSLTPEEKAAIFDVMHSPMHDGGVVTDLTLRSGLVAAVSRIDSLPVQPKHLPWLDKLTAEGAAITDGLKQELASLEAR